MSLDFIVFLETNRNLKVSGRSRQSFESVCRFVSAEQSQSHRVQAVLQTFSTVHLHCVVIGLTHTHTHTHTHTQLKLECWICCVKHKSAAVWFSSCQWKYIYILLLLLLLLLQGGWCKICAHVFAARWIFQTVCDIYQLQGGQQVLAGFKVVQTSYNGGKRSTLADTINWSDDPVAVIMDVKHGTRLLKKTPHRNRK